MPKPKSPQTKRQHYWLRHIDAANASDGTLVAHAKAHKLKVRDLYQWKTTLGRRGLLPVKRAKPAVTSFVPVRPESLPQASTIEDIEALLPIKSIDVQREAA